MPSQQRIDFARLNGAKSRELKTAAGRKTCIRQFQPIGQPEFGLVEEIVTAKWHQRRLWTIETYIFEDEMIAQKEK